MKQHIIERNRKMVREYQNKLKEGMPSFRAIEEIQRDKAINTHNLSFDYITRFIIYNKLWEMG